MFARTVFDGGWLTPAPGAWQALIPAARQCPYHPGSANKGLPVSRPFYGAHHVCRNLRVAGADLSFPCAAVTFFLWLACGALGRWPSHLWMASIYILAAVVALKGWSSRRALRRYEATQPGAKQPN